MTHQNLDKQQISKNQRNHADFKQFSWHLKKIPLNYSRQTQGTRSFGFSKQDCVSTKGCTSQFKQVLLKMQVLQNIRTGRHSLSPCHCCLSLNLVFWQQQNTQTAHPTFFTCSTCPPQQKHNGELRGTRVKHKASKFVQWGKRVFSSFARKASGRAQTLTGELVNERLFQNISTCFTPVSSPAR